MQEREEFAKRFCEVLENRGYSTRGRAARVLNDTGLNISERAVNKWIKGESIPDHANLATLARAYGVSFDWLATGAGDAGINNDSLVKTVKIPYLEVNASCGFGCINSDNPDVKGMYEFTEAYLIDKGLPSNGKGLLVLDSDGDSMLPSIPDNTPLLVNTLENDFDKLMTGKVYVFCANGSVICKRVFKNLDGSVTLRSDNPDKSAYPDQTIDRATFDTFEVIGRLKTAMVEF